jgi:hypothetical protein
MIDETVLTGNEGTAYLYDDWKPGYVVLQDNSRIDDLKFRYNMYFHQMQFIHEEDTLAFSDPEEIRFLIIENQKMIYTDFEKNGNFDKDFFSVLHEGRCSLLQRNLVKYHQASDPDNPNCQKDIYINCCELYLKKGENVARPILCSKKGILNAFTDKREEIKTFMKSNNLSAKNKSDLLEIFEYYNTLIYTVSDIDRAD